MKIGGIQRLSLIDYPGKIGATVFTQGCNFRCPYCHNPDLVDPAQYGTIVPEEQVLSFLNKRLGKLEAVTVTGGEPTIHEDLGRFLETLKGMGYLIKLDTNGSDPDMLERLIRKRLVDYLAMDIKGPLNRYGEIASVKTDTANILKSIELITTSRIEHEFRTTVVRSQIDVQDLLTVAGLICKSSVYVLQPFVSANVLNRAFLAESSYSPLEFSAIRERLKDELPRVIIR
ncbi:MAG: anaerobic ribonucleoside-triphosphate reductase activating protein [Syntrophales bacterium]